MRHKNAQHGIGKRACLASMNVYGRQTNHVRPIADCTTPHTTYPLL